MPRDILLIPVTEIGGLAEVASLIGESRQTVCNWMGRGNSYDFPAPITRLASGPLWDMRDVRTWNSLRPQRRPGSRTDLRR